MESVMAAGKQGPFLGTASQNFHFFLEHTGEQAYIVQQLRNILPGEFGRIGAGKSSLDVLGVGSGDGEIDVQMLSLLQSVFPAVPTTSHVVDNSTELTNSYKALLAKSADLQKIPFTWHIMRSEDYEERVKAEKDVKKFDFIHMIHMVYYLENLNEAIKFYHSLLKENGRLLIILNTATFDWDILWKTFKQELGVGAFCNVPRTSSAEVIACLESQGLKYDEHVIPNAFDIAECFDPSSAAGECLLSFMTSRQHFSRSLAPDVRAAILNFLRNQCSTESDGRVLFNSTFSCILVHA